MRKWIISLFEGLKAFRDCRLPASKSILSCRYISLFTNRMAWRRDVSIIESSQSKLDAIINALTILSTRSVEIEGVVAKLHSGVESVVPQLSSQLPSIHLSKDALSSILYQSISPI